MALTGLAVGALASASPDALLANWSGPFEGTPPFDRVRVADFQPALERAMQENLREIDHIAARSDAPTFDNTMRPLELAGQRLNRIQAIYNVWSSTMNTGEFPAVETVMEPKLAEFQDKIYQNAKLFARIKALHDTPPAGLNDEQRRLIWVYYDNFVRAGAALDASAKKRVAQINQKLAALYTAFNQNLLADETDYVLFLSGEAELAGLPDSVRQSAAASAAERGHPGQWAVLNTRSSVEPFLTYSQRRDLRENVWRAFTQRGDNANAHNNAAVIAAILQLRAERAKLLGFATHAHWRVADGMAKTPENAMALMMQVWPAAVARVHEEVADMQRIADAEREGVKIEPWDYRFYAEKVRKSKYDLDMNEVKPYLQLEKLREGMFWAAGQLYGFSFVEVAGVPVAQPDIRVWEVKNAQGRHVGLWYFDPYARAGKRSGAWMNEYRTQRKVGGGVAPIVSNNSNFTKGAPGAAVLISWDDAVTMFHEFGHALHGLNSSVTYPTLAGTNVARDFVEFPSQLNENWLTTPEVLSRFCVHFQTGQPMPQQLVEKIERSDTFNQGFKTVEYLSSALVDMKVHLAGDQKIDPDAFERATLEELKMPPQMVMRHRLAQFGHLFSNDEYSAGYYSYLWAEVLDHDAFEAFTEAGGPYDAHVARRLHDDIMSIGNTVDAGQAYRNFRGRDPKIDALLRARGFAPAPTASSGGAVGGAPASSATSLH